MAGKKITFHIVLINWNWYDDTVNCVRSILSSGESNYEVWVVDNASSWNDTDMLKASFSVNQKVRILRSDKNLWFSWWNNFWLRAIRENTTNWKQDYVIFLNNDTEVPDFFLSPLRKTLEEKSVGAVQPVIVYHSNPLLINNAGIDYSKNGLAFEHLNKSHYREEEFPESQNIMLCSGCALAMRLDLADELSLDKERFELWDEDYFLYGEDVDLSLRIRQAGFETRLCGKVAIRHKVGVSTKKMGDFTLFHAYKNSAQVYLKNFSGWDLMSIMPYILAMELASVPYTLYRWKFKVWLKSRKWLADNLSRIVAKRKINLSRKKTGIVSEMILRWIPQS